MSDRAKRRRLELSAPGRRCKARGCRFLAMPGHRTCLSHGKRKSETKAKRRA